MTAGAGFGRTATPTELQRRRRRSRRYLGRAESYGRAASDLVDRLTEETSPPFFMLVAHAAELALKAVIAGGRCDDEGLMRLGHDLPLCLRAALQEGVALQPAGEVAALIEALAMPHLAQTLRYPAYMSWPLPEPRDALNALTTLLSAVRGSVEAGPSSPPAAPQAD